MSDFHTFKIKVGVTPFDAKVELDGREIVGVTQVSFCLKPDEPTVLMLEIMGLVEIEGEFLDQAIVQLRQPEGGG